MELAEVKETQMLVFLNYLCTAKDAASVEWREKMIQVITRDRVADNLFKERLLKDKVFICEKHFKPEEILKCKFLVLVIF